MSRSTRFSTLALALIVACDRMPVITSTANPECSAVTDAESGKSSPPDDSSTSLRDFDLAQRVADAKGPPVSVSPSEWETLVDASHGKRPMRINYSTNELFHAQRVILAATLGPGGQPWIALHDPSVAHGYFRFQKWADGAFVEVVGAAFPSLGSLAKTSQCKDYLRIVTSIFPLSDSELWVALDECGAARWTKSQGWQNFPLEVPNNAVLGKEFYAHLRLAGDAPNRVFLGGKGGWLWNGSNFESVQPGSSLLRDGLFSTSATTKGGIWTVTVDLMDIDEKSGDYIFWPQNALSAADNRAVWLSYRYKNDKEWQVVSVQPPALGPQFLARLTRIYRCLPDRICLIGGHAMAVYAEFTMQWTLEAPLEWPPVFAATEGAEAPYVFAKDDVWWGPGHWDGNAWTLEKLPKTYPPATLDVNFDKFSLTYSYELPRHLGTFWTGKDLLVIMDDAVYRRKVPPK